MSIFIKGVMDMTVSGYDSSSISTLFSSLGSGASSGVNGLSSMLSDYYSIKSGSYKKLLTSYYNMESDGDSVASKAKATAVRKTDTSSSKAGAAKREGFTISSTADDLSDSTTKLMNKKLFEVKTTKDSSGKETTGYDVDAITSAVKSFVSDFNSMVSAGEESSISGVATNSTALLSDAKFNKSQLAKIGITVSDDKLKLDDDKFRASDMSVVQKTFQSSGSFGFKVASDVSMISYYAKAATSSTSGYTGSGKYTTSTYGDYSSYV
jgi:hypothetical protein